MASLVSPGLAITVTDETQYVSTGLGTVPLVFVATAQDKTNPSGGKAMGTTKAMAGQLQSYGSQRDLITALGYPSFQLDAAGNSINGGELNEYGLQALYSALGLGSNCFVVRADIDLDQLKAGVRPIGAVSGGTEWFDISNNTSFGIFEWDAITQSYSSVTPTVITSTTQCTAPSGPVTVYTPLSSIGNIGDYAVVIADPNNPIFWKDLNNNWQAVGTLDWQRGYPTVQSKYVYGAGGSNPANAVLANGTNQFYINGILVSITGAGTYATPTEVVTSINNAVDGGTFANGVGAALDSTGLINILADATANGGLGTVVISGAGAAGLNAGVGLGLQSSASAATYYIPLLSFGSYNSVPTFAASEATPAPSGSVWIKTSSTGNGANWSLSRYNSTTSKWVQQPAPLYPSRASALYSLDLASGGLKIAQNTLFVDYSTLSGYPATFKVYNRYMTGLTVVTGSVPVNPSATFTIGDQFALAVTQPGKDGYTAYKFTINSTTVTGFIQMILAKGIPNVSATQATTGAITLSHSTGGDIYLVNISGTAITNAGFTTSTAGIMTEKAILTATYASVTDGTTVSLYNTLVAGNWSPLSYVSSASKPYVAPADGTHWYYADVIEADMMICTATGWKGYRTVSADARGYDLTQTDPNGPIFTAGLAPALQSTGSGVVEGDLWVDTGDLENYPSLYRYDGALWNKISLTDTVSQNGILFADARWDASLDGSGYSVGGIVDPVSAAIPVISTMLLSNYTDLDCPAYQLYPRGTLLWNTRRNGSNVKFYQSGQFSSTNYPNAATTGTHQTGTIPVYAGTWVTVSGSNEDGSPTMGHHAQRAMVVRALNSAIESNTDIREEQYSFQLIACPGYPEVLSNLTALNNDRSNTAFIIGDTPFDLKPNTIDITKWSNTVETTADIYTAIYYPSGYSTDLSGNNIVVPPSHIALRTYIHSDLLSYQWFAPAGARRGLVDNATQVGWVDYTSGLFNPIGVSHSLRDILYTLRINPITVLPNLGLVVWGQKTRSPIAQSTDRVNVSRLVAYIRTILASVGNAYLFEPNDKITQDSIKNAVSGVFNDLVAKRGIYDYVVVCDSSNNTPDRVARNELYVDVAIAPVRAVEYIYIPIRLVNPGAK
jgi:hypothetical protein